MKLRILLLLLIILLSINTTAESDIQKQINTELGLENAKDLLTDDLKNSEIDFSPSNTPDENGLSIKKIFNTILLHFFDSLKSELPFIAFLIVLFICTSIILSFTNATHTALNTCVRFVVSAIVASILIHHVSTAFQRATQYTAELTTLMSGLLPFINSLSLVGGEISTSVIQKAILLSAINILQVFLMSVALPISKITISLALTGYVSGINLGAISSFITSFVTKAITISCGIMGVILYFQNTVTSVADSFALRSVKLAAGSFIPIVGSFVSEASGTLISGVRLVKSTFGIFAICVLIYMSAKPLINFLIIKLSLRFSAVVAQILGCEKESKVIGEISSVYNILSSIMICSTCFFIFFIAVFIKSEVG